jgi:hypothetical protein
LAGGADPRWRYNQWATIGVGPIGEDLAVLIGGSLVFFELSPAAVRDVPSQVLAQYVVGLQGSANLEQARLADITTLALRYGLGSALDIAIVADNSLHEWAEQVLGHTVAELSVNTSANLEFFLACAREAGALIGE